MATPSGRSLAIPTTSASPVASPASKRSGSSSKTTKPAQRKGTGKGNAKRTGSAQPTGSTPRAIKPLDIDAGAPNRSGLSPEASAWMLEAFGRGTPRVDSRERQRATRAAEGQGETQVDEGEQRILDTIRTMVRFAIGGAVAQLAIQRGWPPPAPQHAPQAQTAPDVSD
jgi:hypothetical protein